MARMAIGESLVAAGLVTREQLQAALAQAEGHPLRLCSRLYKTGMASEESLVKLLSEHIGYPGVVLSQSKIALNNLDQVPHKMMTDENLIVLGMKENRLIVGMVNPNDETLLNEMAFVTGKDIMPMVCLQAALKETINKAIAQKESGEKFLVGQYYNPKLADAGGLRIFAEEDSLEIEIPLEEEIIIEEAPPEEPVSEQDDFPEVSETARTILIVDDEKEILNLLSKVVSSMGHIPITAERGKAALDAIKHYTPDVIILDAMLPEVHGFEICKKIKQSKTFAKTPVIMISAIYTGWRYAEDIKNTIGADYFIEKPFKIAEIKSVIDKLIAHSDPEEGKRSDKEKSALLLEKQASTLIKDKKFLEAVALLKKGVHEYPFSSRLRFFLGLSYEGTGNIYGALNSYEDAVRLDSDSFVALKSLASLYQKMGFRHKAAEMWERALKKAPNEELKSTIRNHLMKLL